MSFEVDANLHDIDVQPVRALVHGLGALGAELGEVRRQYGWCNDRFRSHGGIVLRVEMMQRLGKKTEEVDGLDFGGGIKLAAVVE